MLKRITYISRFVRPMGPDDVDEIAAHAAMKNKERGITGMLMTSGGLFYQVIEGPVAAIDELFTTIAHDSRHTDILKLQSEYVDERMFPNWSMTAVHLDADSHVRLLPLKALVKTVFENRRLMENLMWTINRSMKHEMTTYLPTRKDKYLEKTSITT